MANYSFLNLSPFEFETLAKDLLQKELNVTFEAFANGKDKGIDFRFARNKRKKIIVQCKRYEQFPQLTSNLKKERIKVRRLKPFRYILVTSVRLTPDKKEKIQKLFKPFIRNQSDIYGADDINNLIGLHPDVERSHFKLWLTSTQALEYIVQSRIRNQSSFEEEDLKRTATIYVENPSFDVALKILEENKYVVISGIPGIGKSTLARVLIFYFLKKKFRQFVFLSDSIDDGFELYRENENQIFLYDDFLGRNFLEDKLAHNEDQRIIKFIEAIRKSKNKLLILTTREYILAQARQRYDILGSKKLELAKCIIDLSQYTKLVKAKILYNHIFFSSMTKPYIDALLENSNYYKIIDHPNYNPRIIEAITKEIWNTIKPKRFFGDVISFLNNPTSIWEHAFENQISKLSQCILINLATAGTPILYDDLKRVLQTFLERNHKKYGVEYSDLAFKKSIHELENSFVITTRDNYNVLAVEYQNPSIQDFLVHYLRNVSGDLTDLIDSSIYFNQLFRIFQIDTPSSKELLKLAENKVVLTAEVREVLINRLIKDFDSLESSAIYRLYFSDRESFQWRRESFGEYSKLRMIVREIELDRHPRLRDFVKSTFSEIIIPNEFSSDNELYEYINLLREFQDELEIDKAEIIKTIFEGLSYLSQLGEFERLGDIFPQEFVNFCDSYPAFSDKVSEIFYEEADGVSASEMEDSLESIKKSSDRLGVDGSRAIEKLEGRIADMEARQDEYQDWDGDWGGDSGSDGRDIDSTIDSMFNSLR